MTEIDIHEMSIVNDRIYGINYKYSMLCEIDAYTYTVKRFKSLISETEGLLFLNSTEHYRHIITSNKAIYVVNTIAKELFVFDFELKLIQTIVFLKKKEYVSFIGESNNRLFIYAVNSAQILAIDMFCWKVEKYDLPSYCVDRINSMAIRIFGDSLWLTGYIGPCILEVSTIDGSIFEHKIDGVIGDVCLCEAEDDFFWVCTQQEILKWKKEDNISEKIYNIPIEEGVTKSQMPFYSTCLINNCLWLFPIGGDKLLKIENGEFNIKWYKINHTSRNLKRRKIFSYLDCGYNREIIYGLDNQLKNIVLNTEQGDVQYIHFMIQDDLLQEAKRKWTKKKLSMDERLFSLSELIEFQLSADSEKDFTDVGRQIYNRI